MIKKYLFTPGPTPVPQENLLAMAYPIIHHRAPDFDPLFSDIKDGLKHLFQTQNEVLVLASSGTGAMESAVSNFLCAGDKAIAVKGGKFGQRWSELCTAYGVDVLDVDVEWGTAVDPCVIADLLKQNPDVKAVYTTMSETSTGVLTDIEAIAHIVSAYANTIMVVDAITAIGVMDVPVDKWHLDVVVTGSQKALMLPPGLAFISVSDKAWKLAETSTLPKYYFNLTKEKKSYAKNQTAYTPAVSLLVGLRESLNKIKDEGLETVFKRHKKLARATREAMKAIGLQLLAPESPSDSVTAVRAPNNIPASDIIKLLKTKYGITVAGGQEHLKGKIFRIAHLGYFEIYDIIMVVGAVEMALKDLDYPVELSTGVKVAQEILYQD